MRPCASMRTMPSTADWMIERHGPSLRDAALSGMRSPVYKRRPQRHTRTEHDAGRRQEQRQDETELGDRHATQEGNRGAIDRGADMAPIPRGSVRRLRRGAELSARDGRIPRPPSGHGGTFELELLDSVADLIAVQAEKRRRFG